MNRRAAEARRGASARTPHSDRLRVVFFDHCARMSGAEISMLNTLSQLDADADVVLGENGPLVAALRPTGARTTVLPLGAGTREFSRARVGLNLGAVGQLAGVVAYGLRLARRINLLAPDVVVSNSMKGHVILAVARPFLKAPIVFHVHDRISTDFMSRAGVAVERTVIRLAGRGVIANSRSTMQTVPRHTLLRARAVIGGPVAVPDHPTPRVGGGARPLRFGILGRLSPWKGQDLLLDAFARAFPEGDQQLDIAGGALFGEDDYAGSLRAQAEELGIADRVRFLGHVEDVYGLIGQWDCLVHASTIPEPFGLVVAQAMVAGVPIIASAEGGPLEMLDHGRTGLLVAPRDPDALAAALRRIASRPDERAALADAALHEGTRYTADSVAPAFLAILQTVAHRTARTPLPAGKV